MEDQLIILKRLHAVGALGSEMAGTNRSPRSTIHPFRKIRVQPSVRGVRKSGAKRTFRS